MVSAKAKILYLSNLFYPEPWNGIMESVRLLIAGLDRERFDPVIAVRPDDGTQTLTLAERAHAAIRPLSRSRSSQEIRELCRAESFDIVHIQTPVTASVPRLALGARLGRARQIIVTYHLVQTVRLPLRTRLINWWTHRLLVDRTIAVSEGVAQSLARVSGLERKRITVLYNGVAPEEDGVAPPTWKLPRLKDEVWVGYFGRLAVEKGVNHLITALALLKDQLPALRLVLVGDGYLLPELEAQVQAAGLSGRVLFLGYRIDARQLMRQVDLVVLPSLVEGLPYVLIEAMEASRPVVASRIPGTSEVVEDGVTGLLVPPEAPQDLSDALATLARDRDLRSKMAERAHQRFLAKFDARRMVDGMLRVYEAPER
ncbi:MAG TPA: glycosyltransferase family 4 protein [Dehalococcoidia bacterium]|nr:glycosyltransferase family 4 protein [Dehalococcoidia bacterium]